jgi:hypothetical protein
VRCTFSVNELHECDAAGTLETGKRRMIRQRKIEQRGRKQSNPSIEVSRWQRYLNIEILLSPASEEPRRLAWRRGCQKEKGHANGEVGSGDPGIEPLRGPRAIVDSIPGRGASGIASRGASGNASSGSQPPRMPHFLRSAVMLRF